MDFSLSEAQSIFRDSIARFVAQEHPFEKRAAIIAQEPGFKAAHWRSFAELGLLGATIPEAYGGLGGTPEETMIIMEQLGRGLVASPFLATAVLGAKALGAGSEAQKSSLLPRVAGGELKLAFAHAEPAARYDLSHVATRASVEGGGYRIDGEKCVVFYANVADRLIVSARTGGNVSDAGGLTLFVLDSDAPGISYTHYRTQDGARASDIRLDGVRVNREGILGPVDQAFGIIEEIQDTGIAALCAESVGAMWAIYERTLEHFKTREQFGVTIGSLQALQHRLVDVYMQCELGQSMVYEATLSLGRHALERARAVSGAKLKIAAASRHVGQEGIQLHGGIAMTTEVPIGHYFKRITMINATFGDAAHHLHRYRTLPRNRPPR